MENKIVICPKCKKERSVTYSQWWNINIKKISSGNCHKCCDNKHRLGYKLSKEQRLQISKSCKGRIPWNKGKKGVQIGWNKGLKLVNTWNKGTRKKDELICPTCKKIFKKEIWRYAKYCSRACVPHKGKDGGNWKGGITPEIRRLRASTEFKLWRFAVFKRDNFTCQKCSIKGVLLNAHHIKAFSKYKKLRFDITNGITYCKKCHLKEDHSEALLYRGELSKKEDKEELARNKFELL